MGNSNTKKIWMWVGVIVLVAILLYWLFSIDILESMSGSINGN